MLQRRVAQGRAKGAQSLHTTFLGQPCCGRVGNIYAIEVVVRCRITPNGRRATSVPNGWQPWGRDQRVLASAIQQGGTTLKDFTSADGKPGYFVQQLQVYGRGGQACFHCHTLLSEIRLGQRTTVFCSHCQR